MAQQLVSLLLHGRLGPLNQSYYLFYGFDLSKHFPALFLSFSMSFSGTLKAEPILPTTLRNCLSNPSKAAHGSDSRLRRSASPTDSTTLLSVQNYLLGPISRPLVRPLCSETELATPVMVSSDTAERDGAKRMPPRCSASKTTYWGPFPGL